MLLDQVGISYQSFDPNIEEQFPYDGDFEIVVISNSLNKARLISERFPDVLTLGADTIVEIDDTALGKPESAEDATEMLQNLSGRKHLVHTGIALVRKDKNIVVTHHEQTSVWFRDLSDREIAEYIRSGEPYDKAGSYGIQERGALFIEKIEGCFFNVMGLPLSRLWTLLNSIESEV